MRNRTNNTTQNKTPQGKNYYQPLRYPNIPLSSNDIYIITTVGDRLDSLADHFYNDVRLWWIIATANPGIIRRDSYNLKANLELRIPTNTPQILKSFEQINN